MSWRAVSGLRRIEEEIAFSALNKKCGLILLCRARSSALLGSFNWVYGEYNALTHPEDRYVSFYANGSYTFDERLLENGYVTGRPYMGITYLAVTDAQTAAQLGVNAYGIYVVDVVSGGPADKAGLKAGDRIVSIDNTEVAQKTDLGTLMQEHSAGDTLSITVARDGQMQTVSLTLGEKNASNSGNGTNGASRQEKSAESAPQQNPQG